MKWSTKRTTEGDGGIIRMKESVDMRARGTNAQRG